MQTISSEKHIEYDDYEKYKKQNQPEKWHLFCLYVYPIIILLAPLIGFALAVQQLGSAPNPFQHDPKFLGFPLPILHYIFMPLLLMIPIAIFGTVKSLMRYLRSGMYSQLMLGVLLWVGFLYCIVLPFRHIFSWFID